uniref:Putative reverse transcriptase domain-containing protein n=1 Tax=Tanacetum cinerariifolium TaxID=118510 RepID=A0A699GPS5_TANCI|nr:putative reverse transcriptase domain-containing protein [Tanacetum cinerariifolium]
MDTEEVSDRFMAPCFVNGLEAYDGEIDLGVEENMISNEYAVKLCLEHEVKIGNKVVKKELIVALRSEFYFVKFIINPEEDDVEPEVILGRSFLRMTKGITDFKVGTVTIYLENFPFLEDIKEEEKSLDDWAHLLDFNLEDVLLLGEEELPPFVCKMRKTSRNKKQAMENLDFFYQDIGTSSSTGDRVELDGKIVKEEEEPVKRIKSEALKEKDDPEAFIFPIRLERQVNENTLADTGFAVKELVPSSCIGWSHCGDGTAKNQAIVLAGSVLLHWPVPLRELINLGLKWKVRMERGYGRNPDDIPHQRLTFWVCKQYLDKFFIVFIDDILIYLKSKEDHEVHLKLVLELLKKEELLAKFSKYEVWLQEVRFLRYMVNSNDVHVDFSKTEAIKN